MAKLRKITRLGKITELGKTTGLGTDIESVARFEQLPYRGNKNFYSKIFSNKEIKICLAKPSPAQSFAARFAAKESVIKALPSADLSFKDIEIESGHQQPAVRIAKPEFTNKGIYEIKVSFSHTKDYATAVALVTTKMVKGMSGEMG